MMIAGPTVFICDECVELCNCLCLDNARKKRDDLTMPRLAPVHQCVERFDAAKEVYELLHPMLTDGQKGTTEAGKATVIYEGKTV